MCSPVPGAQHRRDKNVATRQEPPASVWNRLRARAINPAACASVHCPAPDPARSLRPPDAPPAHRPRPTPSLGSRPRGLSAPQTRLICHTHDGAKDLCSVRKQRLPTRPSGMAFWKRREGVSQDGSHARSMPDS